MHKEIIKKLNLKIQNTLYPLITSDYVFLELPYYTNIGDTLIWQGTEDFLMTLPHKCLYRCSFDTFEYKQLAPDVVILLQGGGNFGDLYPRHNTFRNKIIELYPNNRIIILPQTVYYMGSRFLANDPVIMRQHKDLYICARDQYSYDFLKRYRFGKNILLVPDMAFCIDFTKQQDAILPVTERVLLFKRIDKEKADTNNIVPKQYNSVLDQKDWVGYENITEDYSQLRNLIKEKKYAEADAYAINTYLPTRVKEGIRMISPYMIVYSNRLHGSILSILLGKEVTIIDNSYGKNAQFYNTWLTGVSTIHIHRVKHIHSIKRTIYLCVTWICAQLGIKI
jgi:exopolysaccharide biosynthesis predicted pyruvyltransferase EpsI